MIENLAARMRPEVLDDLVGQEHLLKPDGFLRKSLEANRFFSLIFFGPPGSGKTTLALIIAKTLKIRYYLLNATSTNKKELEQVFAETELYDHSILIIDEVHRLNKDRQDLLLQYIEKGQITLIGATTANPYHAINPAIRSRCHLLEVKPLTEENIKTRLKVAVKSPKGLNDEYTIDDQALDILAKAAGGDIRYALNNLEVCALSAKNKHISIETIQENIRVPKYLIDKDEDGHYDAVSALQKSIRGSDVDASLYYLARLLASGDLESIFRRLLVTAYEDVGLGNPAAISRTYTAIEAARSVGMPEAAIILGTTIVDLALSPKSKSGCLAIEAALGEVEQGDYEVPRFMRLTPHGLSEEEKFPYDRPDLWSKIQYLPEQIKNKSFYTPNPSGSYEKALIENWEKLKKIQRTADIKKLRKESK